MSGETALSSGPPLSPPGHLRDALPHAVGPCSDMAIVARSMCADSRARCTASAAATRTPYEHQKGWRAGTTVMRSRSRRSWRRRMPPRSPRTSASRWTRSSCCGRPRRAPETWMRCVRRCTTRRNQHSHITPAHAAQAGPQHRDYLRSRAVIRRAFAGRAAGLERHATPGQPLRSEGAAVWLSSFVQARRHAVNGSTRHGIYAAWCIAERGTRPHVIRLRQLVPGAAASAAAIAYVTMSLHVPHCMVCAVQGEYGDAHEARRCTRAIHGQRGRSGRGAAQCLILHPGNVQPTQFYRGKTCNPFQCYARLHMSTVAPRSSSNSVETSHAEASK